MKKTCTKSVVIIMWYLCAYGMNTIVIIIQSHPIYLYQVYSDVCLFANFMTD